tara:strand:- start:968 stop:1855 length:888 start_codon:yes stop_codon:yes gene_type:complete
MIDKIINSTWLDEIGLKLGLIRFRNESLESFHQRCLLQARDLPEPTQISFVRTLSRTIGEQNIDIFKISPIKVNEFRITANDLRVEVDSCFFRVWSDYKNKKESPDLELNIRDRNGAYFLKDIYEELKKLDFINLKLMPRGKWKYLKSKNLMYGSTDRYVSSYSLEEGSGLTKLKHNYIKNINFYNQSLEGSFVKEVSSRAEVRKKGQYYVDYVNGNVHSKGIDVGSCDYSYSQLPYTIKWQPVNTIPVNDKSYSYISKENLINENGKEERLLLNPYGAKIANKILLAHSLQWGE